MNFRQAVLKNLIERVRSKFYRQNSDNPFMRFREMIIFEELVTKLQPKRVLEWGAGYSSLYFPKFLKGDFTWISIENNSDWVKHLAEKGLDKRVEIVLVEENNKAKYGYFKKGSNDGSYDDFKDYIEYPVDKGPFDYIVIDGRARSECLRKSLDILSDGGVVVIHDANRRDYHEHFNLFAHKFLLTDTRPRSGGLAILSKTKNIDELINTDRHEKNWRYIRNGIARYLRV